MRVVIDARESGTSTGRYVDKLIEYLHKLKPEFEIIILTKPQRVSYIKAAAPSFEVIESNFKEFTFSEQIGFLGQLRDLKADLVHFAHAQQPVLYRGRVVTTVHDLTTARFRNPVKNGLVFSAKQVVYKWLIKYTARKSVKLIVPSEFIKKDVTQYARISPSKIIVTHEAADKISAASTPTIKLINLVFLLYVGRPMTHKNLKRLAEAFSIAQQAHPGLKLVLAGKKDVLYERLANWAEKEHIEGLVFPGFVSEGELRWLYEHTAAYVFPSLSEGFGLPGLEAMSHGTPLISSNATCLPEIYGNAAHYFNPTSVLDMANKINEVLDHPKLRYKLTQAGKQQVKKYSWRQMAEQTLAVYREVLSR